MSKSRKIRVLTPKTLYVYPGSQLYTCTICKIESIPRTFKNGHAICPACVSQLGLTPQVLRLGDRAQIGKREK